MNNIFNKNKTKLQLGEGIANQKQLKVEKPKLQCKHFQTPEGLCEFVNNNTIEMVTITSFDRFQAIYFYNK